MSAGIAFAHPAAPKGVRRRTDCTGALLCTAHEQIADWSLPVREYDARILGIQPLARFNR